MCRTPMVLHVCARGFGFIYTNSHADINYIYNQAAQIEYFVKAVRVTETRSGVVEFDGHG